MADVRPPIDLRDEAYATITRRYENLFLRVARVRYAYNADLRRLASDIESGPPAEGRNYKALNAIALAYFYLYERRAEWPKGERGFYDSGFLGGMLALPFSAYKSVDDPAYRDAILAYYEDLARRRGVLGGRTLALTASNVTRLGLREKDPRRKKRLEAVAARLRDEMDAQAASRP